MELDAVKLSTPLHSVRVSVCVSVCSCVCCVHRYCGFDVYSCGGRRPVGTSLGVEICGFSLSDSPLGWSP